MDPNIRLMIIEFKKDSTDNPSLSDFSIFLFIYNSIVIIIFFLSLCLPRGVRYLIRYIYCLRVFVSLLHTDGIARA